MLLLILYYYYYYKFRDLKPYLKFQSNRIKVSFGWRYKNYLTFMLKLKLQIEFFFQWKMQQKIHKFIKKLDEQFNFLKMVKIIKFTAKIKKKTISFSSNINHI